MENCFICGGGDLEDGSSEFAVLTQKGCDKINEVDSSIGAQPGHKSPYEMPPRSHQTPQL